MPVFCSVATHAPLYGRLGDTRLVDLGLVDRAANYQGVLGHNYLTRLADITDGASQTILVTESPADPDCGVRAGRFRGSTPRAASGSVGP